ncbi:MAG: hypothetical protein RL293_1342 [Bacteroidota bacterium]|jgi:hypothetical protein
MHMKKLLLIVLVLLSAELNAQIDNTMYGLYRILNPTSVQLASIDPLTGIITPIGAANTLSTTINSTGAALNPYNFSYTYQDEDSWLSVDLQNGAVLNDVTVTLPNTSGDFNNFRFNTADTSMYGLYSQVVYDPLTGTYSGDMRLATCDLTTGAVSMISPTSIAQSYTMTGSAIDPYLMVYYFESEGKFVGLDLYNGQIYSDPMITLMGNGITFDNFAYSCADTTMYGLIMDNGVKALGKINVTTGVVTQLPTLLNFDNYIMNSGGAIDPVNLVYYFQTMDSTGIKLVGLSLIDGSVVSQPLISANGNYFDMYRIQSDCYEAEATRLNPATASIEAQVVSVRLYPNPVQEEFQIEAASSIEVLEIQQLNGFVIYSQMPNETSSRISVSGLSPGMYLVNVKTIAGSESYRFIKN